MRRAVVTVCVLASLFMPAAAHANGDPASDVLLMQDAYLPYSPKVPDGVGKGLTDTLERASKKGYPLKVAIIASQNDLGAVPQFYGNAQPYADHLESEIAFDKPKPLLIVMPTGFGAAAVSPKAKEALADIDRPDADSGDQLGRAAIDAARAMAAAEGKAVAAPKLPPAEESGGSTSPLVYLVPVLLLALGGGLAAVRARQLGDREEEAAPS